jgi:hypothetical protein
MILKRIADDFPTRFKQGVPLSRRRRPICGSCIWFSVVVRMAKP